MGEENSGMRELVPNSKIHRTAQQFGELQIRSKSVKSRELERQRGECGEMSGLGEMRMERLTGPRTWMSLVTHR